MYSSTLSLTSALDRGGQSTPRPDLFTPGKDPIIIVQEAGVSQEQLGQVWKISPPPEFETRTVQPVASHYTDRAIPAHYSVHYDTLKLQQHQQNARFYILCMPPITERLRVSTLPFSGSNYVLLYAVMKFWCNLPEDGDNAETCRRQVTARTHSTIMLQNVRQHNHFII